MFVACYARSLPALRPCAVLATTRRALARRRACVQKQVRGSPCVALSAPLRLAIRINSHCRQSLPNWKRASPLAQLFVVAQATPQTSSVSCVRLRSPALPSPALTSRSLRCPRHASLALASACQAANLPSARPQANEAVVGSRGSGPARHPSPHCRPQRPVAPGGCAS